MAEIGPKELAENASIILAGLAGGSMPEEANNYRVVLDELDADLALKLARYIARKAQEPEEGEKA